MLEGLGHRHLGHLLGRHLPEGTSGGGQDDFADFLAVGPLQALENGVVLAVDRQNLSFPFAGLAHHRGTGQNKDLLAGDRQILARAQRRQRRSQPGRADDGHQDHVRFRFLHHLDQAFRSREQAGSRGEMSADFFRRRGIGNRQGGNCELLGLLQKPRGAFGHAQADNPHLLREGPGHLAGAFPDGTAGTKQDDALHTLPAKIRYP